MLTKFDSLIP